MHTYTHTHTYIYKCLCRHVCAWIKLIELNKWMNNFFLFICSSLQNPCCFLCHLWQSPDDNKIIITMMLWKIMRLQMRSLCFELQITKYFIVKDHCCHRHSCSHMPQHAHDKFKTLSIIVLMHNGDELFNEIKTNIEKRKRQEPEMVGNFHSLNCLLGMNVMVWGLP